MSQPPATPASLDETSVDDAALLRAYLAGRNAACPQCGYNLRDLTGNHCPECGEELALRLQLSEPKQAAALAGLIALSAGAGMNALLLGYVLMLSVFMGQTWADVQFIIVNGGGLAIMGPSIVIWLRCWRHIRRLGVVRRWMLAAACAALTSADLVIFAKFIR